MTQFSLEVKSHIKANVIIFPLYTASQGGHGSTPFVLRISSLSKKSIHFLIEEVKLFPSLSSVLPLTLKEVDPSTKYYVDVSLAVIPKPSILKPSTEVVA